MEKFSWIINPYIYTYILHIYISRRSTFARLRKLCSSTTFRFKTLNATIAILTQESKTPFVVCSSGKSPKEHQNHVDKFRLVKVNKYSFKSRAAQEANCLTNIELNAMVLCISQAPKPRRHPRQKQWDNAKTISEGNHLISNFDEERSRPIQIPCDGAFSHGTKIPRSFWLSKANFFSFLLLLWDFCRSLTYPHPKPSKHISNT
jgi:hypothetical protein